MPEELLESDNPAPDDEVALASALVLFGDSNRVSWKSWSAFSDGFEKVAGMTVGEINRGRAARGYPKLVFVRNVIRIDPDALRRILV